MHCSRLNANIATSTSNLLLCGHDSALKYILCEHACISPSANPMTVLVGCKSTSHTLGTSDTQNNVTHGCPGFAFFVFLIKLFLAPRVLT